MKLVPQMKNFQKYHHQINFLNQIYPTILLHYILDFVTMGLLLMRNFKFGSAFVNFENFTDRRQSRFSPLVLPPHENPEFPEIYAPTDGFIFSVGIIIKPFGNEEH